MAQHPGDPLVEIVIPVHSTSRPIARAVSSALRASRGARPGQCRVTVVAHHVSADEVRAVLSAEQRATVTVIECEDRGSTAAVPRNEALRRTRARYISFLDSDDTLDAGAVTRWLGIAERRGSDLVIPFQHHTGHRVDITPILRPFRSSRLDPVKDRLGYRSSAFGLVRVATIHRLGARFDEHVRTGEDQAFVLALYAGAARIDYAPGSPGYLVHADAEVRVSRQPLPIRAQVAAALDITHGPGALPVGSGLRASYILKYIRVNFFPSLEESLRAGQWGPQLEEAANRTAQEMLAFAPHVEQRLSHADVEVLRLLRDGAGGDDLLKALQARRRFAAPAALITSDPRWALDRQSPLRIAAASAVQMFRYRIGSR
ncbi:glycosyltransferase family 2 protein [Kocuria rhizophila]|uniref:glycosyltransferase family 2 protein n=1 Tax=Kocuria rhizophila TaxID=72000 RepID=UPI000F52D127|nr:glycosyltransferase [Kocuria rhizophila]